MKSFLLLKRGEKDARSGQRGRGVAGRQWRLPDDVFSGPNCDGRPRSVRNALPVGSAKLRPVGGQCRSEQPTEQLVGTGLPSQVDCISRAGTETWRCRRFRRLPLQGRRQHFRGKLRLMRKPERAMIQPPPGDVQSNRFAIGCFEGVANTGPKTAKSASLASRTVFDGVAGDANQETWRYDSAEPARRKGMRWQMNAIGSGGERDVGALVDQYLRSRGSCHGDNLTGQRQEIARREGPFREFGYVRHRDSPRLAMPRVRAPRRLAAFRSVM